MTEMEIYCTECEHVTQSETPFCSNCGAEDPWDERPRYRFDAKDFPTVFRYEPHDPKWDLWRAFCSHYFGYPDLTAADVGGTPEGFPRLKYTNLQVWYGITNDYEVVGPFLDDTAAWEAVREE